MTEKKSSPIQKGRSFALAPHASNQLHDLLHTVRCIAQYEDALCEMSHELRQSGRLSPESIEELGAILKRLPSQDYVSELEAVRSSLGPVQRHRKVKPERPALLRKSTTSALRKKGPVAGSKLKGK